MREKQQYPLLAAFQFQKSQYNENHILDKHLLSLFDNHNNDIKVFLFYMESDDFRASERTFQLLCQAAGRAGRGDRLGEVIIQTYHPEEYCITRAAAQDYEGFIKQELSFRQLLAYPPIASLFVLLIMSETIFCLFQLFFFYTFNINYLTKYIIYF